jgi:hypothetical protein
MMYKRRDRQAENDTTVGLKYVFQNLAISLVTVVQLHVYSENGADQIVDSTPLQGTTALSDATINVTYPPGFSQSFLCATWAL